MAPQGVGIAQQKLAPEYLCLAATTRPSSPDPIPPLTVALVHRNTSPELPSLEPQATAGLLVGSRHEISSSPEVQNQIPHHQLGRV